MKTESINLIVQIATSIAVLVGIGLVVWELQQTRTLAETQLTADAWQDLHQTSLVKMGENSAAVSIRACFHPKKLSLEDFAVHWEEMSTRYYSMKRMVMTEDIAQFGTPVRQYLRANLRSYLGYEVGMWDYNTLSEKDWDPLMREVAAEIVESNDVLDCKMFWGPMLKHFEVSLEDESST